MTKANDAGCDDDIDWYIEANDVRCECGFALVNFFKLSANEMAQLGLCTDLIDIRAALLRDDLVALLSNLSSKTSGSPEDAN